MSTYQQIVLASRPKGSAVTPAHFRLEHKSMPAIADGQLLVRNHFLSLDPYMRMRMEDVKSYAAPQALDEVMIGGTAGEVIESKHPKFKVGDKVYFGRRQGEKTLGTVIKVNTTIECF